MSDFNAKYIKLSSKYLQEKLDSLKVKEKSIFALEDKKESSLTRFINSFFKS